MKKQLIMAAIAFLPFSSFAYHGPSKFNVSMTLKVVTTPNNVYTSFITKPVSESFEDGSESTAIMCADNHSESKKDTCEQYSNSSEDGQWWQYTRDLHYVNKIEMYGSSFTSPNSTALVYLDYAKDSKARACQVTFQHSAVTDPMEPGQFADNYILITLSENVNHYLCQFTDGTTQKAVDSSSSWIKKVVEIEIIRD